MELVRDIPIMVPRAVDSFLREGVGVGRARWHCVILRLGNLPRRPTKEQENLRDAAQRYLEGYQELEVKASPSDIRVMTEDLQDLRRMFGRPVLREEEVLMSDDCDSRVFGTSKVELMGKAVYSSKTSQLEVIPEAPTPFRPLRM